MPRYRIVFAREWALGRWGFLDRFFHDLGGRESEPSGSASAWVVNYRGPPRQLGRELAMALNIAEADYRQFGPIFDIEELVGPRSGPAEGRPVEPSAAAKGFPRDRDSAGTPDQEGSPSPAGGPAGHRREAKPAAPRGPSRPETALGPTWIRAADVEDVTPQAPPVEPVRAADAEELEVKVPPTEPIRAAARGGRRAAPPTVKGRRIGSALAQAQARWDDLFRIRTSSKPLGRHRSDAISEATRRRFPADRSSL